ncbi:MAG: hypothetical protein KBC95_04225 [Candidatus Peribacteraceae bacterium]|nr:hypothetical protein [Candidatus Peribacteraceae bacterium]
MPIHLLWLAPVLAVMSFVVPLVVSTNWLGFLVIAVHTEVASLCIHVVNHRLQGQTWGRAAAVFADGPWALVNIALVTIFAAGSLKTLSPVALLLALLGLAICSLHIHARQHHANLWTSYPLVESAGLILAALAILLA